MPEPSQTPECQSRQSRDFQGERATTASRMLGNQVIFRVNGIRTPTTKMPRLLSNQEERSAEPVYHARRPHRKSRAGCANCKSRRVKVRFLIFPDTQMHIPVPDRSRSQNRCNHGAHMQHLLTETSQCDETRPYCRKCQIYGISCDYSTAEVQPSGDLSLTRDTTVVSVIESSLHSMSLADLGSRIDQALKLADPSDEWPGTPRNYVHCDNLKALHHFITLMSEDVSSSAASIEVTRGDMVRVAFTVCTETVFFSVRCQTIKY
jgi:hypothetical protein